MSDPWLGRTYEGCRLDERIAASSSAHLYRATLLASQEPVSVAILHPGPHRTLPEPARVLSVHWRLRATPHPSIALVQHARMVDGQLILIMDELRGESLHHAIRRGPMSPSAVIQLAHELAAAAAHLHGLDLVHGKLSPQRVLLTPQGACLLELGAADPLRQKPPAADITAIGYCLYTAATGQTGTHTTAPVATLAPTLPPWLAQLIDDCRSGDPSRRPSNGAAMQARVRDRLEPIRTRSVDAPFAAHLDAPTSFIPVPQRAVPEMAAPFTPTAVPPDEAPRRPPTAPSVPPPVPASVARVARPAAPPSSNPARPASAPAVPPPAPPPSVPAPSSPPSFSDAPTGLHTVDATPPVRPEPAPTPEAFPTPEPSPAEEPPAPVPPARSGIHPALIGVLVGLIAVLAVVGVFGGAWWMSRDGEAPVAANHDTGAPATLPAANATASDTASAPAEPAFESASLTVTNRGGRPVHLSCGWTAPEGSKDTATQGLEEALLDGESASADAVPLGAQCEAQEPSTGEVLWIWTAEAAPAGADGWSIEVTDLPPAPEPTRRASRPQPAERPPPPPRTPRPAPKPAAEEVPPAATLRVVPSAKRKKKAQGVVVRVDGKKVGTAPVTLHEFPLGAHRVEATWEGESVSCVVTLAERGLTVAVDPSKKECSKM